jgi:hypothetical protein
LGRFGLNPTGVGILPSSIKLAQLPGIFGNAKRQANIIILILALILAGSSSRQLGFGPAGE